MKQAAAPVTELIKKALTASRESKHVEFKGQFEPSLPGEWCEVIKDIVAMANSGGGIIVFGLDSAGRPTGVPVRAIACLDPADIADRVAKYAGPVGLEFEIYKLKKQGHALEALIIQPVHVPIVFQKPGTYDIGSGKQRMAFGVGTVYFRHGAKSEPGTTEDIRSAIERELELIRKSWITGVRRVVQAPRGSQVVTIPPDGHPAGAPSLAATVRAVSDPKATPVLLTRDSSKASGAFIHEQVSEGIFDEINNVIDANRLLARGQQHFFLGHQVYYRIYSERQHVAQNASELALLFHSAACDIYAPGLFWTLSLSDTLVAQTLADLYLAPKSPHIHCLLRIAVLLGQDFCNWLQDRWHRKWKCHPQPPSFYFTFGDMVAKMCGRDPVTIAARLGPSTSIEVGSNRSVAAAELLKDPQRAASLLSEVCMRVFKGESTLRCAARDLDYLSYGNELSKRAGVITSAVVKAVGDREADDVVEATQKE